MTSVCPPACDSLYVSFWSRLKPDVIQFIKQSQIDVSTRKKIFAKWDKKFGFQLQAEDDFQTVLGARFRSLKGYGLYSTTLDGFGSEFGGWSLGVSEAESKPDIFEAEGGQSNCPVRDRDQTQYHKVVLIMGSELMHGLLRAGLGAFEALDWWLETAAGYLIEYRPRMDMISINRVDICVDHWGCDWKIADLDRFVCRATTRQARSGKNKQKENQVESSVYRGRNSYTLYVGNRGAKSRFLRIYDKIAELEDSGALKKTEITKARWHAYGWDGSAKVWRAEIEHGREWLKDHGLTNAEKLYGCERELWSDYTDNYHHKSTTKKRLRQNKDSPRWRALQAARKLSNIGVWSYEPRKRGVADGEFLSKMAAGCIDNMAEQIRATLPKELGGDDAESLATRREIAVRMVIEQLTIRDLRQIEHIRRIIQADRAERQNWLLDDYHAATA